MSTNVNAYIWHARFVLINMTNFKVMVNKNLVHGLPMLKIQGGRVCERFQYERSHALPLNISTSRCKDPLEKIHINLMGPTRTYLYYGFHNMFLFVDDSRTLMYTFRKKNQKYFKNSKKSRLQSNESLAES